MISMNMAKQLCEQTVRVTIRFFRPRQSIPSWRQKKISSFSFTTTPCFFGGKRYWFLCSAKSREGPCDRRVGVLYFVQGEYICRRCANLAYRSQQKNHVGSRAIYRSYWKVDKELERSFMEIRSRYFKGEPTKRYRKWLKRSVKHSMQHTEFIRAEWKMLGVTKFVANIK